MAQKCWSEDAVLQEDLEKIAASEQIDWEKLQGKTVLITGATGLIGSLLAKGLVCASSVHGLGIRVLAAVRNMEKAAEMFQNYLEEGLEPVICDIMTPVKIDGPVDYIFHTASNYFITYTSIV